MTRPPRLPLVVASAAFVAFAGMASPPLARAWLLEPRPSWTRLGGEAGASFGEVLAPAGDVNGDGYGDLLVGVPGQGTTGAARLFTGGPGGLSAAPAWTFVGAQSAAATGTAVAPAGDVNGDGYADVIVGSPLHNAPGGQDHGRVDLFYGGANGLSAAPGQTLVGPVAGGQFGYSLATAGDIDGDGHDDIVVGAPFTVQSFAAEGAAYVFLGGPGGLTGPTWTRHGGQLVALLGYAVSGAGDVDADGFADVLVGAPGRSVSFQRDGAAYLHRGSAGGLLVAAAASLHGPSDSAAFGAALSLAGDVNADGYADFLVGAPNRKFGGTSFGEATLLAGGPGGVGGELWQAAGTTAREYYGSRVACAGDLNGDGHPDFAIAADRWPAPGQRRGRMELLLGGPAGPYEVEDARFGIQDAEALGAGLAAVGDLDGDGFSELAVGEPGAGDAFAFEGRITLFEGHASLPSFAPGWPRTDNETDAQFGRGLAGGIDVYGTGFSMLLIGAPLSDLAFAEGGRLNATSPVFPGADLLPSPVAAGHRAGAFLGSRMARVGDVDGDRDEELIAGSPTYSNGEVYEGLAQLFRGSGGGLEATPSWELETDVINAQVGQSVGGGDFNGDGYADLVVGTLSGGPTGVGGSAKAFHGGPGGPPSPSTPSWTSPPLAGNTAFAHDLATGDWDADGYSDLAVGAPNESHGEDGEGRVHVFFGGPTGLDAAAAWILEINRPNGQFGTALDDAGDVDGDGVDDLIVAAPNADPGLVRVFFGNRARAVPLRDSRTFVADVPGVAFGGNVAGIGDVDKDGYADFLVSASNYSNGEPGEGKVWLFRGSDVGGEKTPWWWMELNVAGAAFGETMARSGDLNNDGWPDFAVSAPTAPPGGATFVFLGGGRPTFRRVSQVVGGSALPIGGLVPALAQLFIIHTVRSPAGREKTRVQFQVCTQNEAFDQGPRTFLGTYDTGAPTPDTYGSTTTYAFHYAYLTPGIGYRYRTRNLPHSPYFAPSTWAQPRGFESGGVHFRVGGTVVDVLPPATRVPGELAFRGVTPSPFTDTARIAFVTPRDGTATLDVFDAGGRHVRRLAADSAVAGEHVVAFDGRSNAGVALPAGVYFLRLGLAGDSAVRKLVRLP
jgi:hypothetical protein